MPANLVVIVESEIGTGESEDRVKELEERIGEFIFECVQRKVSSNWLHKEMTKFKQLLEKESGD